MTCPGSSRLHILMSARRTAALAGGDAALCLGTALAADDTLVEMTRKIDRAAEVMGTPADAVSPALRNAYPGVEITSDHANCITQNATQTELSQMDAVSDGFVAGGNDTPSELAAAIAARPETVDCFSSFGLPALPK